MDELDQPQLPIAPTHRQVFIDSERVRWVYNSYIQLWERTGTADDIPLAGSNTPGYLSSQFKKMLDLVPAVGGGFGIVVKGNEILRSQTNPTGVISGDIKLRSDSIDIVCVGQDGVKLDLSLIHI